MHNLLEVVNLPKIICRHAIGEEHSLHHRMFAGTGIMCVGVLVAKAAVYVTPDLFVFHITLDLFGYLIHGIGAVPFVEYLIKE